MRPVLAPLDHAVERGLSRLAAHAPLALGLIALLAAVLLIPGQAQMPLTDRDEARYVLASKQMLESGDFIEPMNLDQPRWKKPAGIYWLQDAAAMLTGHGDGTAPIWAWRLPSSLGILAASLLAVWAFRPLIGARAALWSGLATLGSVVTVLEGHIAKTDAALLAFTILALGALIRSLNGPVRFGPAQIGFWLALSAGVLIKGPVIAIPLGGLLLWLVIFGRSLMPLRKLAPGKGLILFALLTLPWFIAIAVVTDGAFYAEAVGRDLLGKVGQAAEGHVGPPGYYLITGWIAFWPWAALALLALPYAWTHRKEPALRLIAGWIIPTWLVFEAATTKLPHYTMAVLPALGALIGLWMGQADGPRRPHIVLRLLAVVLFALGALVVAGVTALPPIHYEARVAPVPLLAGVVGLGLSVIAAAALWRHRPHAFAALGLMALAATLPPLTAVTLPGLPTLFLSPRMAALDARFDACTDEPLLSAGYAEASLGVIAGTDTRFVTPEEAADHLTNGPDGTRVFVRLGEGRRAVTETALREMTRAPIERLGTVRGINYNLGARPADYALFARMGDPVLTPCLKD